MTTIALIFDFDDTLVPDSTTRLLAEHGIDTRAFWEKEAKGLIAEGYDHALVYLKLLLDRVGPGRPLGKLTLAKLRRFGAGLKFHPGVGTLFGDLRGIVRGHRGVEIEFHVISAGLFEVIEGSSIARNFTGIYASRLAEDPATGCVRFIKRCVSFTEKTRFLFEINKGIRPAESLKNPYLVNKDVPPDRRRVPFRNMIYVGDGITDIPCFSLIRKEGGTCFGVFNPAERKSAKRALLEFLGPGRVVSAHAPRYRMTDELGSLLRSAVANLCERIVLSRQQADAAN